MNKEKILTDLIAAEYEKSLITYPHSNNPHGAFGVIVEELTESYDELENICDKMEELKQIIFKSKGHPHTITTPEIELIDGIMIDVYHAIEELIQTAAMAHKYKKAFML